MTSPATIAGLVARLRQGDTRALARAISLVENDAPEAPALLSACFPHTGPATGAPVKPPRWGGALRIGITGAPGAGKSTLADRLAQQFRHADRTVGLLAVDPTSPFTGGALLGDRIRLREHASDPGFYARSMATRGSLGGLALATADAALVLEASGKDVLLIETVGVGQDEVEIARLADITLVVLVPGMGDDVQSLKAGVMEIADIFVVNKADREGADRVEQEIRGLQSLASEHPDRTPPIVRTIATSGEGIDALTAAIREMEQWLHTENRLARRRTQHWQRRLEAMLRTELMRRARQNGFDTKLLHFHAARIASGQQDPWQLVAQLSEKVFSPGNPT
ncbi:MAG: methylmalonyl Co-A mutase-associated GTPase MeaB [Acidobacteriaceae bacterium]